MQEHDAGETARNTLGLSDKWSDLPRICLVYSEIALMAREIGDMINFVPWLECEIMVTL
jgi:hypothetical protein